MKRLLALIVPLIIVGCKQEIPKKLAVGYYKAELVVQDNEKLAFNFKVESSNKLHIYNAEEVITVDHIEYRNDSVFIHPPVFEGYIAAKLNYGELSGSYIKESLDRVVPFYAIVGDSSRYESVKSPDENVSGNWETIFSKGIEGDEYIAKGIFKQDGSRVTGTFRTTTGDYRFLEGVMNGNQMQLSAFDGAHAFYFKAIVSDSSMQGNFYSGNHWKEPFEAKRNENYELPDPETLTYLNDGYDKFEFSFPDSSGKMMSLSDERFKNKVVLIQVMGTWCPNCLDESKYYSAYYNDLKSDDLEIVALAFEYAKTEEKAFAGIDRLKKRLDINYPILLAQTGTSSKIEAQKKLPMLNHVLSYPTTIFIDKKGEVRKIHTGFNGPATGAKYEEFKLEFDSFVKLLLNE